MGSPLAVVFHPLGRARHEMAAVLYIDVQGVQLGARWLGAGAVDHIEVPIRAIVADALAWNAASVVMAHNHPGGDPTPSDRDIAFTRRLHATLHAIGVKLHDHFIVSGTRWMSFRDAAIL